MAKLKLTCFFLLFLPLIARAADPWTPTQKALGIASTTLLVIDWKQTRTIADNPQQWKESNIILGEHPSRSAVDRYEATAIIGNLVIAHLLPSNARTVWLSGVTIIEVEATAHNKKIGIGFSF